MPNRNWIQFKENFAKEFGEEKAEILDYIAVFDILRMCISGYSNEQIADTLEEDLDYIKETVDEFLGFPGFKETLVFSPYQWYRECMNSTQSDISMPFVDVCRRYEEIKGKVEKFYD